MDKNKRNYFVIMKYSSSYLAEVPQKGSKKPKKEEVATHKDIIKYYNPQDELVGAEVFKGVCPYNEKAVLKMWGDEYTFSNTVKINSGWRKEIAELKERAKIQEGSDRTTYDCRQSVKSKLAS